MITMEKVRIYEKYDGDVDTWARASKLTEQSITDQDWQCIGEIVQSLFISESGQANAEFEAHARARAIDATRDERVYERLIEIARTKYESRRARQK